MVAVRADDGKGKQKAPANKAKSVRLSIDGCFLARHWVLGTLICAAAAFGRWLSATQDAV